jgi:hypothetical protein
VETTTGSDDAPNAAPTAEPLNGAFFFIKPYGRDEQWNITSSCDAASG